MYAAGAKSYASSDKLSLSSMEICCKVAEAWVNSSALWFVNWAASVTTRILEEIPCVATAVPLELLETSVAAFATSLEFRAISVVPIAISWMARAISETLLLALRRLSVLVAALVTSRPTASKIRVDDALILDIVSFTVPITVTVHALAT